MRLYHWGLLLALAGAAGCAGSQPVVCSCRRGPASES
jgi:hypothetical protein